MPYQSLKKSVVSLLCALVATAIATPIAGADEAPIDALALLEQKSIDTSELDLSIAWPVETNQNHASVLHLPAPRSQVVSFVKKCAELEAIPLIEIKEQDDKHVYLGINFDGFLGIYARM